jgi:hypothetical protein
VAAKTFEEWIHDGLENEHTPTNSHGWLRRAWEAATIAAEERFTSTNRPSAQCCYQCGNKLDLRYWCYDCNDMSHPA